MEARTHRHREGFTLLELLVTLVVAGVLIAVAAPALEDFALANRRAAEVNRLLTNLRAARSEAAKRDRRVTLCKSADGDTCASGGDWSQGWIVFEDRDADAQRDDTETLLRVQPALDGVTALYGNGAMTDYISYAPDGRIERVSGAFLAGTLKLCDRRGDASARYVVINTAGRPRVDDEPPSSTLPACP